MLMPEIGTLLFGLVIGLIAFTWLVTTGRKLNGD